MASHNPGRDYERKVYGKVVDFGSAKDSWERERTLESHQQVSEEALGRNDYDITGSNSFGRCLQ